MLLITGSGEQRYCTPASLCFVFFYTLCIINVLLNFMYLFILAGVFSRDYQTQQPSIVEKMVTEKKGISQADHREEKWIF